MTTLLFTGATGFIGNEALTQALAHPAVNKVICLQRRPFPDDSPHAKHANLTQIILKDESEWLSWPDSVKKQVSDAGVGGVVWSLGIIPTKSKGFEHSKRVSIDYTSHAIEQLLASHTADTPIRFTYVSGSAVVRDQSKSVWLMSDFRKMRGQVENVVDEAAAKDKKLISSIARPSAVIKKGVPPNEWTGFTIGVDKLAASLVSLALDGNGGTFENKDLVAMGKTILESAQK